MTGICEICVNATFKIMEESVLLRNRITRCHVPLPKMWNAMSDWSTISPSCSRRSLRTCIGNWVGVRNMEFVIIVIIIIKKKYGKLINKLILFY